MEVRAKIVRTMAVPLLAVSAFCDFLIVYIWNISELFLFALFSSCAMNWNIQRTFIFFTIQRDPLVSFNMVAFRVTSFSVVDVIWFHFVFGTFFFVNFASLIFMPFIWPFCIKIHTFLLNQSQNTPQKKVNSNHEACSGKKIVVNIDRKRRASFCLGDSERLPH